MTPTRLVALGREIQRKAVDEQVSFLAAAVAYYAFVSFVPLLLVTLSVATFLGGDRFASAVVETTEGVLTPGASELVAEALLNTSGRTGATVVGLAVLVWTGLKLFRGLDIAFSNVYDQPLSDGFLQQVLDALVVLVVIALAAAAVVGIGGALPTLGVLPGSVLAAVTLFVSLVVVFLPVYYYFPNVHVGVREALPGTAFAAVGWTVFTWAFRQYTAVAGQYDAYGVLGGALALVAWLYVSAIVIILGGVLNAVLAGRTGGDGEREDADARASEADGPAPDIVALEREVQALRDRVERRTVSRETLEGDLKRYVRRRIRRGHARGWGPYLVLLYGTGMTLGAFFFLSGVWAVLAMVVVWLSTLGLYVLMVLVGAGLGALSAPGRLREWVAERRRS